MSVHYDLSYFLSFVSISRVIIHTTLTINFLKMRIRLPMRGDAIPMTTRLTTGGHMNRDKALAFQSTLTSRINLSSLLLNTFISLDTTTSSGREFHGSTTRDVKLFLHTSRIFLFLYNFLLFFLPGLSANVRKSDGYTSFLSLLSINILKTCIISAL